MTQLNWTKEEARLFHLYALGLHGKKYRRGKAGIRQCFDDMDVLQIDPLPIMGRSHDLVVQARVDGTHPDQALDLIHKERLGFEYWDKVYCVIPIQHFPAARAYMSAGKSEWWKTREKEIEEKAPGAIDEIYEVVRERGPVSSTELKEFDVGQSEYKGWKSTKVANSALDILWHNGKLSVSHRVSMRKYYDLVERVIPDKHHRAKPFTWNQYVKNWFVRRVHNVGLLPKGGDNEVWQLVQDAKKTKLPDHLVKKNEIAEITINGVKQPCYAPPNAEEMLEEAKSIPYDRKARFISPLDPLIWSRNLVAQLWDFEYAWEVYKPEKQRKWGYYVLPVLYRGRFVARFDGKYDKKSQTLYIPNYHIEPDGLERSHNSIENGLKRFLSYLGGEKIKFTKMKK